MRIEYRFFNLGKRKEYCILCYNKTYEPYALIMQICVDIKEFKPICYECGKLLMKVFDKYNNEKIPLSQFVSTIRK